MANNNENNRIPTATAIIGAGIVAAAAAGAYYLYGTKDGPKRRKQMKAWMLRMKADVMEEIENLKEVNEKAYTDIVEKIADKYKQLKNVDPAEIADLAAKMQSHWRRIQKDLNEATGSGKKKSRSSTKKSGSSSRKKPVSQV